jgi:hypothetical protein
MRDALPVAPMRHRMQETVRLQNCRQQPVAAPRKAGIRLALVHWMEFPELGHQVHFLAGRFAAARGWD